MACSGIEHFGTVTDFDSKRKRVRVRVIAADCDSDPAASGAHEACAGCGASALCGIGKGRNIWIPYSGEPLAKGQRVRILASPQTHRRAVLLLLGIPTLVLILCIWICLGVLELGQGVAVLISIGACLLSFPVCGRLQKALVPQLRVIPLN